MAKTSIVPIAALMIFGVQANDIHGEELSKEM